MDRIVKITVKLGHGMWSMVVVVGEDGRFYRRKKTSTSLLLRYSLEAGIIDGDKISFGVQHFVADMANEEGEEFYFGRIGGRCEAIVKWNVMKCDKNIEITVEDVEEYTLHSGEVMSLEEMDLVERVYIKDLMSGAERCMQKFVKEEP